MPKRLLEVSLPAGFRDGTPRQVKQAWLRGNLVRFQQGKLQPLGGWTELTLAAGSASLDSAARGAHQYVDNDGDGLIAIGTSGGTGTNGQLYVMEITNQVVNAPERTLVNITPIEENSGLATQVDAYAATGDEAYDPGYGYWVFGGNYPYSQIYTEAGSVAYVVPKVWSLDNFGEDLLGVHSGDGRIFYWDKSAGGEAKVIHVDNGFQETAPTCLATLVTAERHVLAIGAGNDQRLVRWSSQEEADVWAPLSTNTAGDLTLQTPGALITGRRVSGGVLLFTSLDVHRLNYLGPPLVYGQEKLSDSAGVTSPNAIYSTPEATFWVSQNGFWSYDGYVQRLGCPIENRIINSVDWGQEALIYAGGNRRFNEVIWWFPVKGGTQKRCEYYVIYNYAEGAWYDSFTTGSGIARNVWLDADVHTAPLAVSPVDNKIYEHEVTDSTQTEISEAESGAIDIQSGERFTRISKIYTDTDQKDPGSVNYRFFTSPSGDAAETESADYPLESDGVIDVRLQGRQVRYKVRGKLAADWSVGNTRFELHPGGRR